jgi:hypothetical protein
MNNNIEDQFKRFNNFKNDAELTILLDLYRNIIEAKNNQIDVKSYIKIIEQFFNAKVSCGTCASSLKKAQSDFERVVFTKLYREFPYMLYKPDRRKLEGTRFVNGMFETIVTASFSTFSDLLSSFERDFTGRRINMPRDKYIEVSEELIDFNTKRYRYFDANDHSIYSDYLRFKALYEIAQANVQPTVDKPVYLTGSVLNDATIKEDFNKTEGKYKTQRKIDLTEALELKKEGKTNEEIADTFGVTKQAVGKLFKKHLDINN